MSRARDRVGDRVGDVLWLQHLADLWTYVVSLVEVDAKDTVLKEYVVSPHGRVAVA